MNNAACFIVVMGDFNKYLDIKREEMADDLNASVFFIHCLLFYKEAYMELSNLVATYKANGSVTVILDRPITDSCYFVKSFGDDKYPFYDALYDSVITPYIKKIIESFFPTKTILVRTTDATPSGNCSEIIESIARRGRDFEQGVYNTSLIQGYYRYACWVAALFSGTLWPDNSLGQSCQG